MKQTVKRLGLAGAAGGGTGSVRFHHPCRAARQPPLPAQSNISEPGNISRSSQISNHKDNWLVRARLCISVYSEPKEMKSPQQSRRSFDYEKRQLESFVSHPSRSNNLFRMHFVVLHDIQAQQLAGSTYSPSFSVSVSLG